MTGYKGHKTEILHNEDALTKHVKRVALCVAACEGIDDSMLELLAKSDGSNITNLQHILNKVTWTGLPTQHG